MFFDRRISIYEMRQGDGDVSSSTVDGRMTEKRWKGAEDGMHKGQHARLKLNHPIKHALLANIRLIKIKHTFS